MPDDDRLPSASDLPRLRPRAIEAHKGDFGRALLIGGSQGMAGAVALAGMAALRGGAGLVRLALPECVQQLVAGFEPSYMTIGLPADKAGRLSLAAREPIAQLAQEATVVACGPGLGRSDDLNELVGWLYTHIECPLVVDADALNALASQPELLTHPGGPRILTPHPGEFARLVGRSEQEGESREEAAHQLALRCGVVVLLKGHRTCITEGHRTATNQTGNPGMATGGSGDVLTGLITALWCQGLSAWEAARLGAHLHGLAGDLAAATLGQVSLVASDLLRFLPEAFQQDGVQ